MNYKIDECLGLRLGILSRKTDNIYRRYLLNKGVTQGQLSIMMVLYEQGEIEQNILSNILGLETSSLSRNLVRLINQDFISKS